MSNQFKVSKLWAQRLQEHHISLAAVLRRAGLPPGFFQQEKIYVTTAEPFALSATKHPWNSRLSKPKETNLTCWSIYACPGFFPSARKERMATLNRYELNSYVPSDTANC